MNRPIKFRIIWKGEAYFWGFVEGEFIGIPTTNDGLTLEKAKELSYQFIGIKDENGKEIFEGDVLRYEKYLGGNFIDYLTQKFVVVYQGTSFQGKPIKDNAQYTCSLILNQEEKFEVIGNIWQNPELLK